MIILLEAHFRAMPALNTSAPAATNIPQGGGSGAEKIALFPVVMLPLMVVAIFLLLFLPKYGPLPRPCLAA